MHKARALLFVVAGLLWLTMPFIAAAQGIVPCVGTEDCDLCALGQGAQNVINFLISISILIAGAMFAYAGILYTTGGANPSRIEKAHKIFRDVLIGFLIAISAWLVVQTIISVVFDQSILIGSSWNELRCSEQKRLTEASIGDIVSSVIPGTQPTQVPIITTDSIHGSTAVTCAEGSIYDPEGHRCFDPETGKVTGLIPAVSQTVSYGSCKPSSAFGSSANLMSCICGAESAGIANRASEVDVMKANGRAFSWGLYQINLTANEIRCPGQPVLDCPSAFKGKNYDATIFNSTLYDQCVKAAQNVQCNVATAQYLLNNTPNGATNWTTYKECVKP